MEADCEMAIGFYISDDEKGTCHGATSNGADVCRVKEFLGGGWAAGAIEIEGSQKAK